MLEIMTLKMFAGCVKAGIKRLFYGRRDGLAMSESRCLFTLILRTLDPTILVKKIISMKEWFLLASWTTFIQLRINKYMLKTTKL